MRATGGRGPGTTRGRLARAGFTDVPRAQTLLADDDLRSLIAPDARLLDDLAATASPDEALLGLSRLAAAVRGRPSAQVVDDVLQGPGRAGLLAVLGGSTALVDHLCRHPDDATAVRDAIPTADELDNGPPSPASATHPLLGTADRIRADLLAAVGANTTDAATGPGSAPVATVTGPPGVDALRRTYRRRLLTLAATDLTHPDPSALVPAVAAALADLAAAALEAALALARAEHPDHERARLAVIGMGKCGGRELNYVSDVDVIYVAEPADGEDETAAMAVATRLATSLARACSGTSGEPSLWQVDPNLRPEGRDGPLVRTVASHLAYYRRWARTWEFQALLKARHVAGDVEVATAYTDAVGPLVWTAVERENFVEDARAMRRRVEAHIPTAEADRELKLAAGGLRDVEFTVQLLQLVHGRADESLRSRTTLDALAALSAGGYVARDDASRLDECYRFLRALEHRIQMHRLRRTHLLPEAENDRRRLARAMRLGTADALDRAWRSVRRDVRIRHEALFYRPLLPATATLGREDAVLAPEAARARLGAIGYRDPAGALRHIAALTDGVTRRAAIQRQLLPVLLGWFAEGSDADAALLAFRRLSDELGTTHWFLKLLRDSGVAARRLAHVLSTSRYAADALARSPESVRWLDDDADLDPQPADRLAGEVDAVLDRTANPTDAADLLRAMRRREMARTAVGQVLDRTGPREAAGALTAATDAVLVGALRLAERQAAAAHPTGELVTRLLVVAMGRLGGRETGYGSDADVLFVHDPLPGADAESAQVQALEVATEMRRLLGRTGPEPALEVDADLRPEGRNGPLVRTLAAYEEYYRRWASPWEAQALLRARPVAGDDDLGRRFVAMIAPVRCPEGGADVVTVREVRRLKARMEAERLPRGVEPARHVKLGRGGSSDVEWTAQLLQLRHAHAVPGLRTTSTLDALGAAHAAGLLAEDDAAVLVEAWVLATRIRDGLVLWTGRSGGRGADVLPHDRQALGGLARLLGLPDASGTELEERYLRAGRRARAVVDRVFYT